jgi:hypothetical protein
MYYFLCIKILVVVDLFYNFDHLSYSKNYASVIYFVCYILYYFRYLSFTYHFTYW